MPKTFSYIGPQDFDRSVDLNGTSELYFKSNEVTWGIGDTWSIAIWLNSSQDTSDVTLLLLLNSLSNSNLGFDIDYFSDASKRIRLSCISSAGASLEIVKFLPSPAANVWNHLVATWDGSLASGSRLNAYLNGTLMTRNVQAFGGGNMANSARNLRWGGSTTPGLEFDGLLGPMCMWNVVLTSAAIAEIHNPTVGVPFDFDLLTSTGNYTQSGSVQHYYRQGNYQPGISDRVSGGIDLVDSNLTNANISTDTPA